jgi:hypothetical protein
MKHSFYFGAGVISVVTIVAISMHLAPTASATGFQSTSTPPIHISQQTQFGMMSVNETTGAISFCANNTVVPGSGGGQARLVPAVRRPSEASRPRLVPTIACR